MDLLDLIKYIGFILIIGATLDRISSEDWKKNFSAILINSKRLSFSEYVAGNSLNIFNSIFNQKFLSVRFFTRSLLISLIFVAILFLFLYLNFPRTFFVATSFIRSYALNNSGYVSAIVPFIIFLLFDYVCNGQTQYFLKIMNDSSNLLKFLAIGYADFTFKISLAVLSITLSIVLFGYINLMQLYKFRNPLRLKKIGVVKIQLNLIFQFLNLRKELA